MMVLCFTVDVAADGSLWNRCVDLLTGRSIRVSQDAKKFELAAATPAGLSESELLAHVSSKITLVPEFRFIRETAEKMGVRVWLFGGTAASFLHYAKWDLLNSKGILKLQKDRFDYDFTNIFRITQDLDIAVDATPEVALQFQAIIAARYPHFLGSKANKWEMRTLRHRMGKPGQLGFKEALLNDTDFSNQNTDSNSVGMVEVTLSKEPVVRDLRSWNRGSSVFLKDTASNQISYFRNGAHFTTARAKAGENPEILSVLRMLVKAFQYKLSFSDAEFNQIKEIASRFVPRAVDNAAAVRRIQETATKLVIHAVDIEYAMNMLDSMGLRQKLIAMGDAKEIGSFAWWLTKEPLRSTVVGAGAGRTAKALGIELVAHETSDFLAYESITRAHSGEPNVLISRKGFAGEVAAFADGFYTRLGRVGAAGTGLTIRFKVHPQAREGKDFIVVGDYIIFKNKSALTVIQESINLDFNNIVSLAENDQQGKIEKEDLGLLEKVKRKVSAVGISEDLERLLSSDAAEDQSRLILILNAFHKSNLVRFVFRDIIAEVVKNTFLRVSKLAQSSRTADLVKYVRTVGPILQTLDELNILDKSEFVQYLARLIRSRTSLELRKEALYELLLVAPNLEDHLSFNKHFTIRELEIMRSEIGTWANSPDFRKKSFSVALGKIWDGKGLQMLFNPNDLSLENILAPGRDEQYVSSPAKTTESGLVETFKWRLNVGIIFNALERLRLSPSEAHFYRFAETVRAFSNPRIAMSIPQQMKRDIMAKIYSRLYRTKRGPKYFVAIGAIIRTLVEFGQMETESSFFGNLQDIIQGSESFELRRTALFELLLNAQDVRQHLDFKGYFSDGELESIGTEIKGWDQSPDSRKRRFLIKLDRAWGEAIKKDEVHGVEALISSIFFDINYRNFSKVSILQLAAYYRSDKIINWLVSGSDFNFGAKNALGFTEVEQLRLSGRTKIAEAIEQARPELKGRKFQIQDRNRAQTTNQYPAGTPIVDFVRIEPNTFVMGDGVLSAVKAEISRPFDVMSVDTTQGMYEHIAELIKRNLGRQYKQLNSNPSHHDGFNFPVEAVVRDELMLWIAGLNELSKLDNPSLQQAVAKVLPGHVRGKVYSLPTEAQWELVLRLGGVAEGLFSHSSSHSEIDDYVVHWTNSNRSVKPVGTKRPVFYNGKPLYDLHGNVAKLLADRYTESLPGGKDPLVAGSGAYLIYGGSFNDGVHFCETSVTRRIGLPTDHRATDGFRLVRDAP